MALLIYLLIYIIDMDIYNFVIILLELMNDIKMIHWTTSSYSKHKSTDKLYKKLQKLTDNYIETAIGIGALKKDKLREKYLENIQKKVKQNDIYAKLKDINFNINHHRLFLVDKNYNDLSSILDEILGDINQYFYLSTFK